MPTDPAALRALLLPSPPPSPGMTDQKLFEEARSLLGWQPIPPAVRAGLFRMLAGLPAVRVLGPGTDALGRHGTVVACQLPSGGARAMLIDTTTGKVLAAGAAEHGRITGPGAAHVTITYNVLFVRSGFVARIGDRP
jgi:hypothetical protein